MIMRKQSKKPKIYDRRWTLHSPMGRSRVRDNDDAPQLDKMRRISCQPEMCYTNGVSVPGAFKLDHLQPVEPIVFWNLSKFCTFLMERPILITPERGWLKTGNLKSHNQRVKVGFQCLGHSNWTICGQLRQFCCFNFPIFSLLYCRPILITPESGRLITGKWNSHNLSVRVEFLCLGYSNWIICSLLSQFCFEILPLFAPSYWRPILITPEG